MDKLTQFTLELQVVFSKFQLEGTTQQVEQPETEQEGLTYYVNIAYLCFGVIGLLDNAFTCVVFVSHKPLRTQLGNYFIINLAAIDWTISALLLANAITSLYPPTIPDGEQLGYCRFWQSRDFILGFMRSSIYNVTALSVERFFKIVHPLKYKAFISTRKVLFVLISVWAIGLFSKMAIQLPFTNVINGSCLLGVFPNNDVNIIASTFSSTIEFLIPLIIITYCYVRMGRSLRPKVGAFPDASSLHSRKTFTKAKINIFRTLLTVVAVLIACNFPKQFLSIMNAYSFLKINWTFSAAYNITILVQFSNCAINSFIYFFQYEEFQRGSRNLYHLFTRQLRWFHAGPTLVAPNSTNNGDSDSTAAPAAVFVVHQQDAMIGLGFPRAVGREEAKCAGFALAVCQLGSVIWDASLELDGSTATSKVNQNQAVVNQSHSMANKSQPIASQNQQMASQSQLISKKSQLIANENQPIANHSQQLEGNVNEFAHA